MATTPFQEQILSSPEEYMQRGATGGSGGGYTNPGGGFGQVAQYGSGSQASGMPQRSQAQTPFAPWRKFFGQSYGPMASRSMAPTSAPKSVFGAGGVMSQYANNPYPVGGQPPVSPYMNKMANTGGGAAAPSSVADYMKKLIGGNSGNPVIDKQVNFAQDQPSKNIDTMMFSYDALEKMRNAGMMNPYGSQSMIDALYGQARGDADALRARSNTMASLSGMDPAQAASSYFQRDMNSEGEIQRMLLNARLQSMTQNRSMLEGLGNQATSNTWAEWLDANTKAHKSQ